eukprot:223506-Amphidinium_carterae.1
MKSKWIRWLEMLSCQVDPGIWLNYNRVVGAIRMQQERTGEDDRPCPNLKALRSFYGLDCVHGLGYELDPEMWIARGPIHNPVRTLVHKWPCATLTQAVLCFLMFTV